MGKCCECKKFVWPWQQSNITFDSMHSKCHSDIISKLMSRPRMSQLIDSELETFKIRTGITANIKLIKR